MGLAVEFRNDVGVDKEASAQRVMSRPRSLSRSQVEAGAKQRGAAEELSEALQRGNDSGSGVLAELIQCTRQKFVNGPELTVTESFFNELSWSGVR